MVRFMHKSLAYMTNVLPEKNGIHFVDYCRDVWFGRRPQNMSRNVAEPRSIEGVKKPSRFVTAYGGSTIFLISMAWFCGLLR
jgi:hypothetical protein